MTFTHQLNLQPQYFDLIEKGIKVYEGRLNDEKRKLFMIGDQVIFFRQPERERTIKAKIVNKFLFKDFDEMASKLEKSKLGFADFSKQEMIDVYHSIYPKAKVEKYGVVVFEIKLI